MGQVHLHNFRVLNRSQNHYGSGLRWIERCRCGCTINCDATFAMGRATAQTVKHWFDRNGQLINITGKGANTTNANVNVEIVSNSESSSSSIGMARTASASK